MPPVLDLEQGETSSAFPQVSPPVNLVNSNKSFMSSVPKKKKRVMEIYYMQVQIEKDVAALQDSEEELEPPEKKIQMEEITCPEEIHTTFTSSQVTTKELLTDNESSLDIQVKDERERAESPAEPQALEECSKGKTPESLAAPDSGFQCVSCYRIFPSLEVLQKHVEHASNSWSSEEDGSQPESFVMVPASSNIIGETSSASTGYFSCASSECELGSSDEDGKEDAEVDSELGKG
ncbi:hypothetical protein Celaphus_00003445, partial [Cervus elaphus hippelaphus]